MIQAIFGPLLTAMVTPFDDQLAVDYQRLTQLADFLLERGATGLVAVGTTGESPTLTETEKIQIFQTLKDHVGADVPIIAGTGSYSTQASVELSQAAEKAGADGLLLVNPYYNKPSQEGLYQHFRTIAEAVSIPIILYNHPGRTGVCIAPETMEKLAQIDNIIGVKDSSGDLNLVTAFCRCTPDRFLIYSGDDPLTLPILALGGYGVVSVCSHIGGPMMSRMLAAFKAGDLETARHIHMELFDLMRVLFCAPSPAPTKAALAMIGMPVGGVRLPLVEVTDSQHQQIRLVLDQLQPHL